jgi:putative CocE/NonD family hydrolase
MLDVDIRWGLKIPMSDGVKLHTTLYKPSRVEIPLPVIFTITPYGSDIFHEHACYFAQNQFIFVLIDCRGRGNSEGAFEPNINEGRDGYDVTQWLAEQAWSNGRIAMWGVSYAGHAQWATAKEFPSNLCTIAPASSPCPGIDFPMVNNIFFSASLQWLTLVSGRVSNRFLFGDVDYWLTKFREVHSKQLPFRQLDKIAGNETTLFQEYLEHPTYDSYWQRLSPTEQDYKRLELPILTITGQYDANQRGALFYYRRHTALSGEGGEVNHYLVIGPWDHAGTRSPSREFGGLRFGPRSLLDLNQLHREWYEWILKDGEFPSFLKDKVACYITGLEEWRYAHSLDGFSADYLRLYIGSRGDATDVFQSGVLHRSPTEGAPSDSYIYSPLANSVPLMEDPVNDYLTDETYAFRLQGRGLIYHSEPFVEGVTIIGLTSLELWLSMDVPDTDMHVALYEITAAGQSIFLTEDVKRMRYAQSLETEQSVEQGTVFRCRFDTFRFFARRLTKGSRLRLTISAPSPLHWQTNYNSGGRVADETVADARDAHITLHHNAEYQSYLTLSIAFD